VTKQSQDRLRTSCAFKLDEWKKFVEEINKANEGFKEIGK